jgi:hypothetical protein
MNPSLWSRAAGNHKGLSIRALFSAPSKFCRRFSRPREALSVGGFRHEPPRLPRIHPRRRAAPAIVRADSLMRIVPMETLIFRCPLFPIPAHRDGGRCNRRGGCLRAGRELREWSQYDLARAATLTRYDVQAESVNGVWQQLTVDFMGGDANQNRDIARAFLAGRLRADGVTPTAWKGHIPDGARLI